MTVNLVFNYLDPTDIAGNESNYQIIRVSGSTATGFPNNCGAGSPCVNTAANTATINGVSNFSDWTLGESTTPAPTPTGRPAFTPMVRVNSAGAVAVTYYDFRNLGSETTTLPTDYWITFSKDGARTFGGEQHISGPWDMLTAPYAVGYFVGDYEGLAASGTTFRPFWVQANSGNTANRTDVFTTTFTP